MDETDLKMADEEAEASTNATATQTESSSPAPKPKMSARAKAEARRRRILEQSKNRMGVVSGEVTSSTVTQVDGAIASSSSMGDLSMDVSVSTIMEKDGGDGTTNNDEEGAAVSGGGGETNASTIVSAVPSTKSSSSGASRLAQMRKRRYKKSSANVVSSASDDNKETAAETEEEDKSEKKEDVVEEQSSSMPTPKSEDSETVSSGKKYLGVAKMRRKMLAEQKAASQASEFSSTDETATSSLTPKTKKVLEAEKRLRKQTYLLPILFQLITVLCLFLSGLDVGLQNHYLTKQTVHSIHADFSFVENGVGALSLLGLNKKDGSADASSSAGDKLLKEQQIQNQKLLQQHDVSEFDNDFDDFDGDEGASVKPRGATSTTTKKEPNIDPIFQLDLDEFTSGPGFIQAAARFAVKIHRTLTFLFLILPKNTIQSVLTLPGRLLANPPILFLCALIIRYVGRHILGGKVPDLDEILGETLGTPSSVQGEDGSGKDGGKEKDGIPDLLGMGTNFVKGFVKTNFPKLVLAYTIFKDARADMLVIFCGFLIGLIFPVQFMIGQSRITEEL